MKQQQQQEKTTGDSDSWKDRTVYRFSTEEQRPKNTCDYRQVGGPLLRYVWCTSAATISSTIGGGDDDDDDDNNNDGASPEKSDMDADADKKSILQGQTLYLGAEISSADGCMYCIPGHAERVLKINPQTDHAVLVGPAFVGKYKWLRGVEDKGVIYGLPCHADTVMKIDVPNHQISELPIQYEEFFPEDDRDAAHAERYREWKYHGGNISPVDGCIYAIPQSARYVLKVDPVTDICTLVAGPKLDNKYQFYGGVVGKQDGAIYGIPHNCPQVLRIHPNEGITLHGELTNANEEGGEGGHKWHGGAAAPNGVIVCVAANADTVLCITPVAHSSPIITFVGDETILQSGRHRSDRKYKYLGATAGPDGRVYCFPCASEHVLAVDTVNMTTHRIGPNIYDSNMERLCQNKWQNGVYIPEHNCIFGIPLAAESLLQIDFKRLDTNGDPTISTWPIPAPHSNMGKWEGAVVAHNGVAYSIPNNHKASLRIEMPGIDTNGAIYPSIDGLKLGQSPDVSSTTKFKSDRADYSHCEKLIYKSGIPTLRASAHRVKFSPKSRKCDPCPKDNDGKVTGTLWLPKDVCDKAVFSYDTNIYNFRQIIAEMLRQCDTTIVGCFRDSETPYALEDFIVCPKSTWRTVNGGQCEQAQKYLSDTVSNHGHFLNVFDDFVTKVVLPHLKSRLTKCLHGQRTSTAMTFYYQRPPTLRLQPGPAWAQVKAHNDAEYGHQFGELNYWVPLTNRQLTGVDLYCESSSAVGDYNPIPVLIGEVASFHGSSCRHFVNANSSEYTRISFDFRVGVKGFFDPEWEMKGTNDDHLRREFIL